MTVEKKDIDWGSLGFGYMKTDYSYEAHWKDGEWDEGGLTTDHTLHVSECGGIFHYCQEVFEGLKAYTAEDGSIVCFRPDMNAERMYNSAQRLEMPPFPKDKFVEAVKQVVSANAAWVPPFGSGATLYVRPFMIGSGDVIGVAPAPEYTFRILVTPVGPYFKGGLKPVKLRVSEYDRAAPHGTGNIKAGLNYAMSLKPTMEAHREGYAENLYLDSESRTYVEETGGANVLFVKEDGTLVVPQSHTDSILPSITRRSLVQVAQDLGMTVDQRPVEWAEVKAGTFVECGLCGTAAVISPVGEIDNKVYGADETVTFPAGYTEIGPVMKKLRETLTGILRTSGGEGFLGPAECAGRELVLCPAGSAMSQRAMINLNKDGARPFRLRFCFASRHVGAVATCIFASILQSKVPAYRSRAKNREFSMFSTNDGRGYGLAAFDLQGYSRSLAFIVAPEALGYVEYS